MRTHLIIAAAAILAGCSSGTRRELARISASSDPAELTLERGFNEYVCRTTLKDGTEAGIVMCRDGSSSRYWFRSHHLTNDDGGALFHLSDGTQIFMSGGFCCEVQLPDQQFASLSDLREFIRQRDGVKP